MPYVPSIEKLIKQKANKGVISDLAIYQSEIHENTIEI